MPRIPVPGVGVHARDRMAERIGRDLTREEWLAAVAGILDGRAHRLCLMPNGSEHYLHEIGGVALRLVWMPKAAMVVTVFPLNWGATEMVARAKAGRVRRTLDVCAKFRQGRRLSARTCWVAPEERQ